MTLVSVPVTGAQRASGGGPRAESTGPGFALYVGMPESTGPAGRARLAELARRIVRLVEEAAPEATAHATLAVGARGDERAVVDRFGRRVARAARTAPATERAREAWSPSTSPRLVVDVAARGVTVDGEAVPLTRRELMLLAYLLRAGGRAVSREELLRTVWRKGVPGPGTRTIDVHVRRLREKLGGCLQIVTIRGVGYRCDPTPEVVLVGSGDAG